MRRLLITLRSLACAATVVAVIGAVGLSGAALAQDAVPRGRLSSNGCERTTLSGVPRTSSPLTAGCALVTRPAGRHQTTVGPLGSQEPTFWYSAAERAPAIPNVARWSEEALQTTVGPLGLREPTFQYSAAKRAPAIPNVATFSDRAAREPAHRVPTAHPRLSEAKVFFKEGAVYREFPASVPNL
jgi:hypothetical protein